MGVNLKVKIPKFLKSVKYTLAAVNGVFLLTGVVLVAAGAALLVRWAGYEPLLTGRFSTVAGLSAAIGAIILLTAALGVYAALSQHFYFVAAYTALMAAVLVLEVGLTAAAFALRADAAGDIRAPMLASLQQYGSRLDVAKLWDDMQMELECCGVVGRFDYISNQIPVSCCHIDYGTVSPFECHTANAHPEGCAGALGSWLAAGAGALAYCALVALCFQVVLTAMSGWLAWRSKFEEVELES